MLLAVGMFVWLCLIPVVEAAEQTILQKVVPPERQGRVFGFAQSVEQAASPITAFLIGPIAQFVFIPFMTTGAGVELLGGWFGTGPDRGLALLFTVPACSACSSRSSRSSRPPTASCRVATCRRRPWPVDRRPPDPADPLIRTGGPARPRRHPRVRQVVWRDEEGGASITAPPRGE